MKYLLTSIYIILTTCGITFFKLGGDTLKIGFGDGFSLKIGWITTIGLIFYLVSFILWQKLLVKYDLSTMVPIVTGISQIIIMLIGYAVFKEKISIQGIIGASLIIVGIVIMSFPKN